MYRSVIAIALALLMISIGFSQPECLEPGTYWKCPVAEAPGQPKVAGFGARVETRISFTENAPNQPNWLLRDSTDAGDDYNTRRLRMKYAGQTRGNLLYFVQVRRDWGADEFEIHDAYVTCDTGTGPRLTAGQMSTPFDRQFLTSDVKVPRVNRPRTSVLLVPARDIGILAHDCDCTNCLGWYAGVFTGNGKNELNVDSDIMPVARIEWMATPCLNIGANWMRRPNASASKFKKFMRKNGDPYNLQQMYDNERIDEKAWGIDAQCCCCDGTSIWAGYTEKELTWSAGGHLTAEGWYLEATRPLQFKSTKNRLEAVAGYEDFDANNTRTDRLDARCLTLGCNYHIQGCRRQMRCQYLVRDEAANDVDNDTLVIQYDHAF